MNRTTLSLIAAVTALLAVTGLAALTAPGGSANDAEGGARQRPVERSSLLCPSPGPSDLAETSYTSFTPGTTPGSTPGPRGTGSAGSAELRPAAGQAKPGGKAGGKAGTKQDSKTAAKPLLSAKEPGKPVAGDASGADQPALIGAADGRLAPGWTVQQTTAIEAGDDRGLFGMSCSRPDTDFWFPGASTAKDRSDYVHLTNPDDSAAVADIELYGTSGRVASDLGEGIQIRPHESVAVLLSTLTDHPEADLTVHVTVRSGRVAAALRSADAKLGGDWLPPAAVPADSLVLPGIPKDATAVRLIAFAPGDDDADLGLELASPTGSITPAGHESLHVKSGMTAAVELGDLTRGEPGSLLLRPSDAEGRPVPVVAALQVVRGKAPDQEMAYIPATAPVDERATAAGSQSEDTVLSLVAPEASAQVRVTSSAGTEGGSPASKTYTVKGGTTLAIRPPAPSGLKGAYAVTVEPVSGGDVYASRMLELRQDDVSTFTIQTMPDDQGTVQVPTAKEDVTVAQR